MATGVAPGTRTCLDSAVHTVGLRQIGIAAALHYKSNSYVQSQHCNLQAILLLTFSLARVNCELSGKVKLSTGVIVSRTTIRTCLV